MKKILFILAMVVLFSGCVGLEVEKPKIEGLIKLTETSFVEIHDYNSDFRSYHIRIKDMQAAATFDSIYKSIFEVEGVQNCTAYPYLFNVTKSKVYSWAEIEPEIKEIFEDFERFAEDFEPEPEEPNKSGGY